MDTSWPGFTSSLHRVSVEVEEFCDKGKSLTLVSVLRTVMQIVSVYLSEAVEMLAHLRVCEGVLIPC
jgi:hypothetical protein